eukprot:ctg_83.g25
MTSSSRRHSNSSNRTDSPSSRPPAQRTSGQAATAVDAGHLVASSTRCSGKDHTAYVSENRERRTHQNLSHDTHGDTHSRAEHALGVARRDRTSPRVSLARSRPRTLHPCLRYGAGKVGVWRRTGCHRCRPYQAPAGGRAGAHPRRAHHVGATKLHPREARHVRRERGHRSTWCAGAGERGGLGARGHHQIRTAAW